MYEAQSPSQMKNPSGSPIAVDKSSSVPLQLLCGSGSVVLVVLVVLVVGIEALEVVLSAAVVALVAADDATSSDPSEEQLARVNTDARQKMRTDANRLFPRITVGSSWLVARCDDDKKDLKFGGNICQQ
jgi:hypothetical protein